MHLRLFPFFDEITAEGVFTVLRALLSVNPPNGIYVNSPGGRFDFFSSLGPAIERQGIITLSQDVSSAAVLLTLLGHKRYAFGDSTFYFHEVRAMIGDPLDEITICDIETVIDEQERIEAEDRENLEEWLFQMRVAQSWFLQFIARRTGVRPAVFLDLMRQEATLNAREAVHYGIIHEVLPIQIRESPLLLTH
ncbi:ATP-dependent Clp protease proteolytic subunit [Candidatus Nomurabacteria bacterium]|nr:ATP-dependent Clp protease proteolytic subunit [Candidatus Nomurabacteria bacterium]